MAAGKNQKNFKKKGLKKKIHHPFAKKEWHVVKAPNFFDIRNCSWTPVNKTQGNKISTDALKGRVFEIALSDLVTKESDHSTDYWRKFKLICEDVDGQSCLTNFYGMDITRDKLCQLIKKWHTLIEGFVDVKTQDGYFLRMFSIAFTKKKENQVKATCYAKSSHIKQIRKKMMEVMATKARSSTIRQMVEAFMKNEIGQEITDKCHNIFPLENCMVRKVKVLKRPKLDHSKLREIHEEAPVAKRAAPAQAQGEDAPKNLLAQNWHFNL